MTSTTTVDGGTRTPRPSINFEFIGTKLVSLVQVFRPSDGWIAVVLLAFNFMVVLWSVDRAHWVDCPSLVGVVLLAMITGLVLSRVPKWAIIPVFPLGLVIGLWVIMSKLTSSDLKGIDLGNSQELWERLALWLNAATTGSISIDQVPFAFGLMIASWLSGYLAVWIFVRFRNFWGVFILGGFGLISNLTYLPATASIDLGVYLLTALMLIARVQSVRRRQDWDRRGVRYDGHLGLLSLADSFFLAFLVVLPIAFFVVPAGKSWQPTHNIYEYLLSPLTTWEDGFNRLFAGLPARKPLPYRIWGDVMAFQGTINPTTTPVLQVSSPVPMYWKARTYGTYTSQGWVSDGTVLKPTDWHPSYAMPSTYHKLVEVNHAVTPNYSTKNLFAGGQVLSVDRDARIETYDSPTYTINLSEPPDLQDLSPDLAVAALNLERVLRTTSFMANDSKLAQNLPQEFVMGDIEREQGLVSQVTIVEVLPEHADTLSLRTTRGQAQPGETYQITSSLSLAEPHDLRTAGVAYPTWTLDKYTQLPDTLPHRVYDLANQLTAEASNPYDKAVAIEEYLKTFTYTLKALPPVFNADGVDHFLQQKQGYSEYFGSAMTVMLRTQNIPARLVTGYTVGDKLPDEEVYIVTDSHSHAWLEVYFPNYGWIPFEPTPGNAIPRAFAPVAEAPYEPSELPLDPGLELDCDDDEDCDDTSAGDLARAAGERSASSLILEQMRRALPWILGVIGFVTVLTAVGVVFWRRYMTPSMNPQIAFRRLGFLGALGALAPVAHQTPYQYQERLSESFPTHADDLSIIVGTYVRSRYGRKDLNDEEASRLTSAWMRVRLSMLLRLFRSRN